MKAAILIESLTGNTWKAGELIAANLQQEGWQISGFASLKQPDHAAVQEADVVVVGTWVHGLFVVGQAPWGVDRLRALPSMAGKQVAGFCTYALNPGKALDVLTRELAVTGGNVIGGLSLQRGRLSAHAEDFAARLADGVTA